MGQMTISVENKFNLLTILFLIILKFHPVYSKNLLFLMHAVKLLNDKNIVR